MNRIYIKCLGSGDAFGSGGRNNTSFYITFQGRGILLDCGASTLVALKREGLSMDNVDIILITHLHGDHFGGLPFILCEIAAMGNRKKTLTIVGPDGIEDVSREALACFYPGIELKDNSFVQFISFEAAKVLTMDNIQVQPFRVIHSPESKPHALRVTLGDRTIAYSGDTEWTDELIKASRDADLFICEGTTYDRSVKNHLSIQEVLQNRDRLSAKRIVFTHLSEQSLNAAPSASVEIAEDGMVLMS